MTSEIVKISDLDQERFGIITAKTDQLKAENIDEILDFCARKSVAFLISRCHSKDIHAVHAMEKNGFLLMETLLELKLDLTKHESPIYESEVNVRLIKPEDIPEVVNIARESFSGYYGHYHADPRLDREQATEVYSSWAYRCCSDASVADRVFVVELDQKIVGFRAFRFYSPQSGGFFLAGVSPQARNKGIFKSSVIAGNKWCRSVGLKELTTSTHLLNIAVQKVCIQLGYEIHQSFYTFHKWFD